MFIEVVRREVFSYSSIWGEEIVRYSFIYLAWIGAAAAVKERGHIRIDVMMNYVPDGESAALHLRRHRDVRRRRHRALLVVGNGARLVEIRLGHPRAADQPVFFLFAVPFGFALVIFRLVQSFLRDLADLRNGRPVYEGDKLFD
jgi:TRAP-type C4-dicarboxylate transport system permease small subunit